MMRVFGVLLLLFVLVGLVFAGMVGLPVECEPANTAIGDVADYGPLFPRYAEVACSHCEAIDDAEPRGANCALLDNANRSESVRMPRRALCDMTAPNARHLLVRPRFLTGRFAGDAA